MPEDAPRPPARGRGGRLRRGAAALFQVHRGEAGAVACLFLLFFCVIFVFWCLKPLRTASVVKAYGTEWYPLFRQGTALVMPVVVGVYSVFADRLRRDRLFLCVLGVFVVLTMGFWGLLRTVDEDWPAILFFFYVDTYVTVGVAMFWSYVNDVNSAATAKRLYGVIGAGGISGGMAGAAASGWLTERLGDGLLLVTVPVLLGAAALVLAANRIVGTPDAPAGPGAGRPQRWRRLREAVDGARIVAGSRYLVSIAAIVGLYELVSVTVDYVFTTLSDATFADREAMAAYQGRVFFFANLAALLIQVFLVSWVHRKFGVKAGLVVLPAALLVGNAVFAVLPALLVISAVIAAEGALQYSINQSSKEVLYTPTDRETNYKAKAFIDMLVYRLAKAGGGALLLAYGLVLADLGMDLTDLSLIAIALLALWLAAVGAAGRRFRRLEGAPLPARSPDGSPSRGR